MVGKSDFVENQNIWHQNPDNQAKIARVLQTGKSGMNEFIRAEDIKKSFNQKFTKEDFNQGFEKEREIIEIKNKVIQNCKNGNRSA